MEPYVTRSRIRRGRRCPERVSRRSRFSFKCHRAANERKKERKTRRKVPNKSIKEYKEMKVRMHK